MTGLITNEVNYESMLIQTYGSGLYQILLTFLYSMTSFMYALDLQSMIFMHYKPPFNCTDPRLDGMDEVIWLSTNSLISAPTNLSQLNLTENSNKQCWALIRNHTSQNFTKFTCTKWNFEDSVMRTTVVSQFNLVCDSEFWIPAFESSVLFFNSIGFLMSSITDVVGRRIPFLLLCTLEIVMNILTPFGWSPLSFLVLRCLHGLTAGTSYIGMILATELVPQDKRAIYGSMYWLNFSIGYMACAGLAYWNRNWTQLRLWFCVFNSFYLTYPYMVRDTPRWLGLNHKIKQVIDLIKRLAKWNKVKLDSNYLNRVEEFLKHDGLQNYIKNSSTIHTAKDKFTDIFLNAELRKRTITLGFVHTGLAMVYFGLITNNEFASTNIFLNVFLLGLVEAPANFVGWKVADMFGRRVSTSLLLGLSCLAVIGTETLKHVHPLVQCSFAIFGKFLLTVGYCVADLYIVELYPTTLRTRGMFLIVTLAGFGSALSPYVNQLYLEWEYLPCLVYGSLCMISALLVYFYLPETKNQPLIQTVRQCYEIKLEHESNLV